jgi:hypothetical protein
MEPTPRPGRGCGDGVWAGAGRTVAAHVCRGRAAVQNYTLAPDRHIQAEIYMMQSMEGAAEVFTRKSGPGERPMALGDGGAKGEYYIVFHRGRFVVTVAAGDATAGAEAAVLRIARAIESRIPNRCP